MASQTDSMDAAPLARLIYRSRSVLAEKSADPDGLLATILQHARHNNERAGLTGVLLFDGETFVQALEGSLGNIERVYEAIACDQRHEAIELIDLSIVESRDYPNWTMAFLNTADTKYPDLRRFMTNPAKAASPHLSDAVFDLLQNMLPVPQHFTGGLPHFQAMA